MQTPLIPAAIYIRNWPVMLKLLLVSLVLEDESPTATTRLMKEVLPMQAVIMTLAFLETVACVYRNGWGCIVRTHHVFSHCSNWLRQMTCGALEVPG